MNNISIIGSGYVGLVTGACLSEFGMNVICVDKDENKINMLDNDIIPIYEPGLQSIVSKNRKAGRLSFTTDIKYAIQSSQVIFIAVGTPPLEDGSADLNNVLEAAEQIAEFMNEYKIIVNKSTVPVGTGKKVKELITGLLVNKEKQFEFDVVSNPEFLREGSAVRDFMHPDRVVIGAESERAVEAMKNIYNVLYLIDTPFVITSIETAEITKYACNAFLATKISFINEIANICDLIGADVHHVAKAMGLDGRIGNKFLHPGPGFGGSCFPKDTKAISRIAQELGYDFKVVNSVIDVNNEQRSLMINKVKKYIPDLEDKQVAILGLAFKPETDDLREAPSIDIIKQLQNEGAKLRVYDPVAMDNMKKLYGFDLYYSNDEYEACMNSDCLIILTEWNQFRRLDLVRIRENLKKPVFLDLRNVYEPEEMRKLGFVYEGVGRR